MKQTVFCHGMFTSQKTFNLINASMSRLLFPQNSFANSTPNKTLNTNVSSEENDKQQFYLHVQVQDKDKAKFIEDIPLIDKSITRPLQSTYKQKIQFILQSVHEQQAIKVNKQNYLNGRPIKGKIFKKKEECIIHGNKVIAEWKNEQLHGQVQISYKNGCYFKGRYEQGMRIKGYFNFGTGYEYTGGFFGDKFRGYGQLTLTNKKVICGDWQGDLIDGNAEIKYPTGQIYYGEVTNFKKHGKGYLFFNNGQKYIGEFFEGHITGNGQYYENQALVSKGYWMDGELMYGQNQIKNYDFMIAEDMPGIDAVGILQQMPNKMYQNK